MPDVKCLGADPSAVVDGLATGTEVGPHEPPAVSEELLQS